ncbi:ankyrin [Aureobasidium pullulans]|nr:ankyrin [Aureobasidium pullulans]
MFEAIHHKIERAQLHGRDADQVGRCISQCSSAITSLQLKLHKFEEGGPQDKFGRLKKMGHRLQYPFEKTTLLEIKANISDIRADLTEAMAILQMDISVRSYQKTEEVGQQITQTLIPSIDGIQAAEKNRAAQEERNTILMWLNTLSPSTFTNRHHASLERRKEGTGLWMFEEKAMKQWLDGTMSTLWCPGDPGSGKSVAMSIVVEYLEHLRATEHIAVAYTYCVYNQEHQTAANFLASLLAQVSRQSAGVHTELRECWKIYHSGLTKPSSTEYVRLLKAMRGHFLKSFILVDALDEFPEIERRSLLRELKTLVPEFRILITSRNIPSIKSHFEDAACMQIRARDEDVRTALAARIGDEEFMSCAVDEDPILRDDIINTISQKTKGMFLVAELHITALSQEDSIRDLRETLEALPGEIADTYSETMIRINKLKPKQAERAHQVLCWLTHARRPLEVRELQQALAIRPTDRRFVHGGETSINTLLSYCMGLVIMETQQRGAFDPNTRKSQSEWINVVRYVHYTAQEFFDKSPEKIGLGGHHSIARTCISALLLSDFDLEACLTLSSGEEFDKETVESLSSLQDSYPIVRYAAQHWGDHVRLALEVDVTSSIIENAQRLLQKQSNFIFSTWLEHAHEPHRSVGHHPDLSAPHVIAPFGITHMFQRPFAMLDQDNVDVRDSRGRTPLHLACQYGHFNTMRVLLERGADMDAESRDGSRPLGLAIRYGHEKLVKELLDVGADFEKQDFLRIAIANDRDTSVHMLLKKTCIKDLDQPLLEAVRHSKESTVRKILQMMEPLSEHMDVMFKALLEAIESCVYSPIGAPKSYSMINVLLEKGAELNRHDSRWGSGGSIISTPLSIAGRSLDIAMYLVERGALVSFRDPEGRTVLYDHLISPESGRFFITKGANINERDLLGRVPLHDTATGSPELLRLFLENDAEVNVQDEGGETPLHQAVLSWQDTEDTMRNISLLLQYGASVDIKDNRGYTPLHHAIFTGGVASCEAMLEFSQAIKEPDSVLQLARLYDILRTFIRGPLEELNARTKLEGSVADQLNKFDQRQLEANRDLLRLELPCKLGLDNVVRRFLAAGADCQAQVSEGFGVSLLTLDHYRMFSTENGAMATLELLLDHGLPIDTYRGQGTALTNAIRLGW